jgi:L-iditol 2-dehydrogenase
MQAIVVRKIGSFAIEEVALPVPGARTVLVQVAVTGLCRTDLKLIEAGHRDLILPRIPGEEVVGTVVAVGPAVDPALLHRRVYLYPGVWCGSCPACRKGAENLCERMRIMGFHRDGGFAEYVAAPVQSLIPLPDALAFEQAVFAEPLSCGLNALQLAGLASGERIGIWGAGPAGLLLARASVAMGAEPVVIEPCERRRAFAHGVAAVPDTLLDVAIVAVGAAEAYTQALSRLAPRGRLVVFSGLARDASLRPVDFNQLHYQEQTLVGAYGCSYRHGVQALDWIAAGRVPVTDLISHRLPLAELGQALDLVRSRQGIKILLDPVPPGETTEAKGCAG